MGGFTVVSFGAISVTPTEARVLRFLSFLEGFNQYFIVKSLKRAGIPESTVKYALKRLIEKGLLELRGRFYYLSELGKRVVRDLDGLVPGPLAD